MRCEKQRVCTGSSTAPTNDAPAQEGLAHSRNTQFCVWPLGHTLQGSPCSVAPNPTLDPPCPIPYTLYPIPYAPNPIPYALYLVDTDPCAV